MLRVRLQILLDYFYLGFTMKSAFAEAGKMLLERAGRGAAKPARGAIARTGR